MSLHGRVVSAVDRVELDAVSLLAGLTGLCLPALVVRLLWRTHAEFRGAVLGVVLWLLALVVVTLAVALLVWVAGRSWRRRIPGEWDE